MQSLSTRSFVWLGRTPGGVTSGSRASCASWVSASARRRCGGSSRLLGSDQLGGGRRRRGQRSSRLRPTASWPATSSPWRRSGCAPCTCSSSSKSRRDGCTSRASRPIPTRRGYPSRRGISVLVRPSVRARPVPAPGPGRQVLRRLRRGLPDRRRHNHSHPGPCPASERLRRAVGEIGTDRVSRLDPGSGKTTYGARCTHLHGALQPRAAASRAGSGDTRGLRGTTASTHTQPSALPARPARWTDSRVRTRCVMESKYWHPSGGRTMVYR